MKKPLNEIFSNTVTKPSLDDIFAKPKEAGRFTDVKQDIKEIGTGIKESFIKRREQAQSTKERVATGQSPASTAIQALGQSAGLVSDVIGEGVVGAGKALLKESEERKIKGAVEKGVEKVVETPIVQSVIEKYNSLKETNPEAAANVDALLGVGSLALDIGGLGVGGEAAKVATRAVKTGAKAGLDVAEQAIKTGAKTVKEVGGKVVENKTPKLLSIFTGEKDDIVRSALENPEVADLGIEGGDEALRKAVQVGSDSSIKAKQTFVQAHKDAFKKLVKDNPGKKVSRQKLLYQFVDDLEKAGAKVKNGKIDFSTSKITANPGEIAKINSAYEALKKWKDFSPEGTNELKQLVGQLTKFANEAGGSSKSPFLGKYYNFINEEVANSLPPAAKKSYQEMNKRFTDTIGLYDDMVDAFNSGDPFSKLAQVFGNNKDTLRQVVDFYEKTTGNKIAPIVAGRTLAESKPAAFGFLNPRQWIDFFIDPKTQAKIVTKVGKIKKK